MRAAVPAAALPSPPLPRPRAPPDLDKWEDERAARMRLMAKRHKAQQRVFEAKHPGKR